MRKIRLGKTFNVYWTILTNTEALPLAGRDLTLEMTHALKGSVLLPFTIEGDNVICARIEGAEQTHLGVYSFTLWENYGKGSQSVVDRRRVFALVSSTEGEDDEVSDNIATSVDVTLDTANMAVGIKGDKGEPFRFEDFTAEQIAELQRPATEAAEVCGEVTEACGIATDNANIATANADSAAGRANTAAEDANAAKVEAESATRQAQTAAQRANTAADNANAAAENAQRITDTATLAEAQRVTAENERQSAEADRATAELARSESEQVRSLAETARASAEQTRQADEVARADAESARLSAEQARATAETARASAEVERQTAESARASAESARASAEQSRVSAESARATAESQRQTAETARVNEYASIVSQSQTVIADTEAARLAVQGFADTVQLADTLERDLARYDEEEPITLTRWQSNKAIANSGTMVSKANYVVSNKVRLHKGYTYLFRPANGQPIDTGVALCARVTDKSTTVLIDYSYTYDEQGRIATATALYDTTKVYTYAYSADGVVTITDNTGEVVVELPQYRIVEANVYVPMFVSLSDTMPKSGYYAVTCGEDCDAVWSVPNTLGQVLVVSYGFIRSIVNTKADKAAYERTAELAETNAEEIERQIDDERTRHAALCESMFNGTEKGWLYAKIKAGTSVYGVKASDHTDTWVWLPKPTYNHADNANILEIAYVGQWSEVGNLTNCVSVKGYEVSKKAADWDYLFQKAPKLKKIDLSNCPRVGAGHKRSTFSCGANLTELYLPRAGVVFEGGAIGAAWYTFGGNSNLRHLDVSMVDTSKATNLWRTFTSCGMVELDLSMWDVRRLQELQETFSSMRNLRYLNLKNWDTRSGLAITERCFRYATNLYIDVSPSFFAGKPLFDLASGCFSVGFVKDTNAPLMHPKDPDDTRHWLRMIAETAPTIRLADGWDQEAWDADKLEENEDTPKLLTQEDGTWCINDGIARSIKLHADLKAQEWAQEWLALLQSKGYSIV